MSEEALKQIAESLGGSDSGCILHKYLSLLITFNDILELSSFPFPPLIPSNPAKAFGGAH